VSAATNRAASVVFEDDLEVVHAPKMMPWGNCAAQFRDPEGTLVGMYTPTTEAAKKRFGGR
jgi:uncharacterized glyoxalase superfamily protein PhnB